MPNENEVTQLTGDESVGTGTADFDVQGLAGMMGNF